MYSGHGGGAFSGREPALIAVTMPQTKGRPSMLPLQPMQPMQPFQPIRPRPNLDLQGR